MSDFLDPVNPLIRVLIRVPIVLLALTVHEFCHGYFAYRMGDPTALRQGRLTLNPLKHLDPLGTLCLMFAPIGWAKPVPINPLNFHDRRKGILVTTAAGPASNLAQAILFALLLRAVVYLAIRTQVSSPQALQLIVIISEMVKWGVIINVGLAVFNCLPFYPLDGFHITLQLMRPEKQQQFVQTMPYGPFAILALVLIGNLSEFNILMYLIGPPAEFIFRYFAGV